MHGVAADENLKRVVAHHDWWSETYHADVEGMVLYNKITLDNIRRFLPHDRDGMILDAGGGTGLWAIQLAEMGYRVVLTDASTGMLDKARENISDRRLCDLIEVRLSDITAMPEFADGSFAMVICQGDPVSYCGYHVAAVREFARVVRRGGAVIVSVDNRAGALNWFRQSDDLDAIERIIESGDLTHPSDREEFRYTIHAFTPEELSGLFESNGLSVERIIGKPVIANRLALREAEDPAIQERLLQMELKHCNDPAYIPWAGHLEIAGRKR